MEPVGTELKLRRLLIGAQQQQVAAKVGISASALSRIEHGWLIPSSETLELLRSVINELAAEQEANG